MQEALLQHIRKIWPDYELGERICSGSSGEIYRAVRKKTEGETTVDDYAAVKIIEIPKSESEIEELRSAYGNGIDVRAYYEAVAKKYLRQVKQIQSLGGKSNMAEVREYRCLKKQQSLGWAIVMLTEFLTPLTKYAEGSSLEESEVIKLGIDICTALEEFEKRGIVHGDITPDNIFADVSGNFKLGDLGTEKTPGDTACIFANGDSPDYLAPEAQNGRERSAASDLYSLGLVLYRMMNGSRPPFLPEGSENDAGEIKKALDRRFGGESLPPAANASKKLNAVLGKACAFDARSRFRSAAGMKRALIAAGDGTLDIAALAAQTPNPGKRPAAGNDDSPIIPAMPKADDKGFSDRELDKDNEKKAGNDGGAKKRSGAKTALALLAGALALGALVFGAVMLIKNLGQKNSSSSANAENTPFEYVTIPPNGSVTDTPDPAQPQATDEPEATTPPELIPKPEVDPMRYYSYCFDLGKKFAIAVLDDGSVVVSGTNQKVADGVADWDGVVRVAAGWYFAIGLTSDGRVLLAGTDSTSNNRVIASEIAEWQDIEFISANACACAAIDKSGHLYITGGPGDKDESGLYSIPEDIYQNGRPVAVSVGVFHVLVLFDSGKVAAIYNQEGDWCSVGDWKNIVQVSAGERGSTALDVSGNVLYIGNLNHGQMDFYGHNDVASICVKGWHLVYVTKDGKVEACGYNSWDQIDVSGANRQGVSVTAIATSAWNTAVLLSDGEVVLIGYDKYIPFSEVESWNNIAR